MTLSAHDAAATPAANGRIVTASSGRPETASAAFGAHSAELLQTLAQSHTALQTALAANDAERLAAWLTRELQV